MKHSRRCTVVVEEALAEGEEALGGVRRRRGSTPEKEAVGELLGSVAAAVGALLGCGGGGGAPGLSRRRGRGDSGEERRAAEEVRATSI